MFPQPGYVRGSHGIKQAIAGFRIMARDPAVVWKQQNWKQPPCSAQGGVREFCRVEQQCSRRPHCRLNTTSSGVTSYLKCCCSPSGHRRRSRGRCDPAGRPVQADCRQTAQQHAARAQHTGAYLYKLAPVRCSQLHACLLVNFSSTCHNAACRTSQDSAHSQQEASSKPQRCSGNGR